MEINVASIISNFEIDGTYSSCNPTGSGHINDTYHIRTKEGCPADYILQRINHSVFKDVEHLMNNFLTVTRHLAIKQKNGVTDKQLLKVIPAKDGKPYFIDKTGNYWRVLNFISGGNVYEIAADPRMAFEGGKAFGSFLRQIADIPVESIFETLPDFHNAEFRIKNFWTSVKADPKERVKSIAEEIAFVRNRIDEMLAIPRLQSNGLIPVRVTHNDTKFNNIIFDSSNKAICVVDLDTIMPGSALFDFGDAIRAGAISTAEDEQDLEKVALDMNIFESYTRGYLGCTFDFLTDTEISMLAFSVRFMTFVIGLRFLTDYIDGDTYFRIKYDNHNLIRARTQFKLVESIEQHFDRMNEIVRSIALEFGRKIPH